MFEDFYEQRQKQKIRDQATATGMTVQQFKNMREDKAHRDEMKEIESQEQADADAEAEEGKLVRSFQPFVEENGKDPQGFGEGFRKGPLTRVRTPNGGWGWKPDQKEHEIINPIKEGYEETDNGESSGGIVWSNNPDILAPGSLYGNETEEQSDTQAKKEGLMNLTPEATPELAQVAPEEVTPQTDDPEGRFKIGPISGKKYTLNEAGVYVDNEGFGGKELGYQIPQEVEMAPDGGYKLVDPNQDSVNVPEGEISPEEWQGHKQGGGIPEAPAEVTAPESQEQTDELGTQMLEVQKAASEGNKEAVKVREQLTEGLSKEDKALAKEEFGNYYVGPGGFAINLDTVEASRERAVNMSLLQFVPDHAKPYMLAKWGYLDPEDVKGMPESPEYNLQELKGIQKLAQVKAQTASNEKIVDKNISGKDALATKLYASQKELNAANNTLRSQLENRRIDLGELQLDADLFMHGDELDLKQYLEDKKIDLNREELQQLDRHFTKKLSFEYSQLEYGEEYKQRLLDQGDAQFNRKFGRLDRQDQEAMVMANYNRTIKTVDTYIAAGQFSSAVLASAMLPTPMTGFNVDNYYKNKAKTSGTDPIFTTAMGMTGNIAGYNLSNKEDVKALRNGYYTAQNKLVSKLMKGVDPQSGEPSFLDTQMGLLQKQKFENLPPKTKRAANGSVITPGKDLYNNNKMQYRSAMRIEVFNMMMKKDPVYGPLHNNINNARTHYQTKGSLEGLSGVSTTPAQDTTEKKPLPEKEVKPVEGVKSEQQEIVEKELASASNIFKKELSRGDEEYVEKFASWFRSPSSKKEALKVGKKDLGSGLRRQRRALMKEHQMDIKAIDKLLGQPKKLVKFLKRNMRFFEELSPEAKFYIAQEDSNINIKKIK